MTFPYLRFTKRVDSDSKGSFTVDDPELLEEVEKLQEDETAMDAAQVWADGSNKYPIPMNGDVPRVADYAEWLAYVSHPNRTPIGPVLRGDESLSQRIFNNVLQGMAWFGNLAGMHIDEAAPWRFPQYLVLAHTYYVRRKYEGETIDITDAVPSPLIPSGHEATFEYADLAFDASDCIQHVFHQLDEEHGGEYENDRIPPQSLSTLEEEYSVCNGIKDFMDGFVNGFESGTDEAVIAFVMAEAFFIHQHAMGDGSLMKKVVPSEDRPGLGVFKSDTSVSADVKGKREKTDVNYRDIVDQLRGSNQDSDGDSDSKDEGDKIGSVGPVVVAALVVLVVANGIP